MFLDDQLYQKVKSKEINKPEDFKELVNELYRLCESYYKGKLPPLVGCSYKDVTQLLDKTFKFWDMAIDKLDKENWVFTDLLKLASYKSAFMNNEKLKEMYEKGK